MNYTCFLFVLAVFIAQVSAIKQPIFRNTASMPEQDNFNRNNGTLPDSMNSNSSYGVKRQTGSGQTAIQMYGKALPLHILKLLQKKDHQAILELLRKFIKVEKVGRYRTCIRMFGRENCSLRALHGPRPFFIWKNQMVHSLLRNPTSDVLRLLKNLPARFQ